VRAERDYLNGWKRFPGTNASNMEEFEWRERASFCVKVFSHDEFCHLFIYIILLYVFKLFSSMRKGIRVSPSLSFGLFDQGL
jgi:hypothetical protein